LAAGGDIAAAEIGDDVDPGKFSQQRRVIGLAGEAQFGAVADSDLGRGGSELAGMAARAWAGR